MIQAALRQLLTAALIVAAAVAAILWFIPGTVGVVLAVLAAFAVPSVQSWHRQRNYHHYMQNVLDVLPQPVFIRDARHRFVFANAAYLKASRRTPQIIGRSIAQVSAPEMVALMCQEDSDVLAGGSVSKETVGLPGAGGLSRHLLISKARAVDACGKPVVVGTHFDISVWRRAERELQSALQREVERRERVQSYIQRLIDVIPQPVYVKDAQSRYLLVNEAFCRERGKPAAELVGQVSYKLAQDSGIAQTISAEDSKVLAGERVLKEENLPHMYTGQERFRLISKGSCLDSEGLPVIVGCNFDVTSWRQAERGLQAALEREVARRQRVQDYVQRLIDVIPHPVYVKDANSRYLLMNEAFARDRGRAREALVGTLSVTPDQAAEQRDTVLSEDAEVLQGKFILKEEHRPHPYSGHDRYRVVAKGSCLDAEGEPVIVCATFDITNLRQAEARWMRAKEAAERANETKSLFLANISHELRTPMHAVLSFARLGVKRSQDLEGQEKLYGYFSRIVQSGESLLHLLNDLLDLSKLEAGRVSITPRPFNLITTVESVRSEFAALLDSRHLKVHVASRDDDAIVMGEPSLIAQVLRNLLSNAIKFSPEYSPIDISLRPMLMAPHGENVDSDEVGPPEPAIELIVADHGPGIPEGELEQVFDKFVQSSKTVTGAGGTGLGLAICREIMHVHRGEIFARNRATANGTEFVMRLLAANPQQPLLPSSTNKSDLPG